MSHLKKRLHLFVYPAFRWYLLSCVLATVGAGLGYISITWLVLDIHNSVGSVAVSMMCFWLPGVFLGPFMGVVVDRFPFRHHLLALSIWVRALFMGLCGWYFYYHHSIYMVYLLGIILGIGFSVYLPAAFRLTREMVPEEELLYANATIDMVFEVGNIVGMGLAGFFITLFQVQGTMLINAIFFVMSGFAMLGIRAKHLTITPSKNSQLNVIADFKAGLDYILSNKNIMVIYTIQLIIFVMLLTAPVLLAPFAREILHTTAGQFGQIEMSLSAGAVVGGLFLAWFADKYGLFRTMIVSLIILGCSYAYFGYNRSIMMAELLYFIMGVALAMWPLLMTVAQKVTDISYQGRVQSCFSSISGLLIVLTYLAVKLTSGYVSLQFFYWIEVVFTLACLWMLISNRKRY